MWPFDIISVRANAISLYKRGLKKTESKDAKGALADYNRVLEMPNAPADVRAMVLFNRALIHSISKDYENARIDLVEVLNMNQVPAEVKVAAKRKLERMKKLSR